MAIVTSVLSVLAFDFFFVPPYYSFAVTDTQYLVTFAVMLAAALVITQLTTRIRQQASAARQLQRRSESLYNLSTQLASTRGSDNLLDVAVRQLSEMFDSQVLGLQPDEKGQLIFFTSDRSGAILDGKERSVAQWAFDLGQPAGWGTENLPYVGALYVPLLGLEGPVGVMEVRPHHPERQFSPEQTRLLEAIAKQVALSLEVERLQQTALKSQLAMEAEHLKSSILSSVTHDFQTPLAAVMGSASSLLEQGDKLSPQNIRSLAENIYDEAERLSRLINNLLRVTRLQSGTLVLHKELQPLEEVVGAALNQLERRLQGRPVAVDLPRDLPMVPLDGGLAVQVFINLLENAIKYTPPGSPLEIAAMVKDNWLEVQMRDRGPGLAEEEMATIFEMFQRGASQKDAPQGHGLGLAICRAIVQAHGGSIWVSNRPQGGAVFFFSIPLPAGGEPAPLELPADDSPTPRA